MVEQILPALLPGNRKKKRKKQNILIRTMKLSSLKLL